MLSEYHTEWECSVEVKVLINGISVHQKYPFSERNVLLNRIVHILGDMQLVHKAKVQH